MTRQEQGVVRTLHALLDKTISTDIASSLQNPEKQDPYREMFQGIAYAQKSWEKRKKKPSYSALHQGVITYTMQATDKLLENAAGNNERVRQTQDFMIDFAVVLAGRLEGAEGRTFGRREDGSSIRWELSQLWEKRNSDS